MAITLSKDLQKKLAKGETFTVTTLAAAIGKSASTVSRTYLRIHGENPGRGQEFGKSEVEALAAQMHEGRGCPAFADPDSPVMVAAREKRVATMEKAAEKRFKAAKAAARKIKKRPVGRPRKAKARK